MKALTILAAAAALVAVRARAGTLDDWVQWRIDHGSQELEEQLGPEIGDRYTEGFLLDELESWADLPQLLYLPTRRVVVPPVLRLTLSCSDHGGLALAASMEFRGWRRVPALARRSRRLAPPNAVPPAPPTGEARLDDVLWTLAVARQKALHRARERWQP